MVNIPSGGLPPSFRTATHGYPKDEEEEEREGGFFKRMAGSALDELLRPIKTYGQTLAEGLYQGQRFATDPTFRKAIIDPESVTEDDLLALETSPDTMFLSPEQMKDRGEIAKTGLGSTIQSMATVYGAPKAFTKAGLTTAAIGMGLGGGISAVTDQDVATGMGRGAGQAPQLLGLIRATDPTIHAALAPFAETPIRETLRQPVAQNIVSRAASGVANIIQGNLIDKARQQETTPIWQMVDFVTGAAFGKGQFRPWVSAKGEVDPDLFSKYINSIGMKIEPIEPKLRGYHLTTPEEASKIKKEGYSKVYGEEPRRYVVVDMPGTKVPEGYESVDIDLSELILTPRIAGEFQDMSLPKGSDGFLIKDPETGKQNVVLDADVAQRQMRTEMAEKVIDRTMSNVVKADIAGYLPLPGVTSKARKAYPASEVYMGEKDLSFKFMDELVGRKFASVDELYKIANSRGVNKTESAAIKSALRELPDEVFTYPKGATKEVTTKRVTKAVKSYDPETKTLTEISPKKVVETTEQVPIGKVSVKPLVDYVKTNYLLPTRLRLSKGFSKIEIGADADESLQNELKKYPAYREGVDNFDVLDLFFRPKYTRNVPGSDAVIGNERFKKFYPGYNNEPKLDIYEDSGLAGKQNGGFLSFTLLHEAPGLDAFGRTLEGNHDWEEFTKGYFGQTRGQVIPDLKIEKYLDQLPKEMQVKPEEIRLFSPIKTASIGEIQQDSAQAGRGELAEIEKVSPLTQEVGIRRTAFSRKLAANEDVAKAGANMRFIKEELPEMIRRALNLETLYVVKRGKGKWSVRNRAVDEVRTRYGVEKKIQTESDEVAGAVIKGYGDRSRQMIGEALTPTQARKVIAALEKNPELAAKFEVGEYSGYFGIYRKIKEPKITTKGVETESGEYVDVLKRIGAEGDPESLGHVFKAEPKVIDKKFSTQKAAQAYIDQRIINPDYANSLTDKYKDRIDPKGNMNAKEVSEESLKQINEMVTELKRATVPGEGLNKKILSRLVEKAQTKVKTAEYEAERVEGDLAEELEDIARNPISQQDIQAHNKLSPYVNNFESRNLRDALATLEENGFMYAVLPYDFTASYGQGHLQFDPTDTKYFTPPSKIRAGQNAIIPGQGMSREAKRYVVTGKKGGEVEMFPSSSRTGGYDSEENLRYDVVERLERIFDEAIEEKLKPKKEIKGLFNKYEGAEDLDYGGKMLQEIRDNWGQRMYDEFTPAEKRKIKTLTTEDELVEVLQKKFHNVSSTTGYSKPKEGYEYLNDSYADNMEQTYDYNEAKDIVRAAYRRAKGGGKESLTAELGEMSIDDVVKLYNTIADDNEMVRFKEVYNMDNEKMPSPRTKFWSFPKNRKVKVSSDDLGHQPFNWKTDMSESHQPIYHRYFKGIKKNSYPYLLKKLGIQHAYFKGSRGFPYILIPLQEIVGRSVRGHKNLKSLARLQLALLPFAMGLAATQEEMPEEPEKLGSI